MSRCIIHIGMRKTGSSSIQQSLNGFVNEDYAYADINGHPNHGGVLYSVFADDPASHVHHKKNGRAGKELDAYIADARKGLEKSIAQGGGRNVIYSGEGCRLFTDNELRRLREYFLMRFAEVKIVAYVRPPAAYITSNFQQRVKDAAHRVNLQDDYFNYEDNFRKFDDVFERENVELWKFDPKQFPGGCVVRDFCAHLGIHFPPEKVVRVNESLSKEAVSFLFTYRRFGEKVGSRRMTGPENRRLVDQLKACGDTKFRFSPGLVNPVLDANRADIDWMEARLGQSLREELGDYQPGDVRDEGDLLHVDISAVGKLMRLLEGQGLITRMPGTPEQVALLVHALREGNLATNGVQKRFEGARASPMQRGPEATHLIPVSKLVEEVRQESPTLFEGLSEDKVEALIQGVFQHVHDALAGAEEGAVRYSGLGEFRIKQVEKEAKGQKVMRTQIIFRGQGSGGNTAAR